jgi:LPS export ABC transporter protein LptC
MKRKKIQLILILIVLVLIGLVLTKFIRYRRVLNRHHTPVTASTGDASLSIGKIEQTAVRNGTKEWKLEAVKAEYIENTQQVLMKELSVTFFLEDGRNAVLTADEGILNKASNDIEVMGNVLIVDDRFRLETERLCYYHRRRMINSNSPIRLVSEKWDLRADSMSMNLATRKTLFEGSVDGIFKKKLLL